MYIFQRIFFYFFFRNKNRPGGHCLVILFTVLKCLKIGHPVARMLHHDQWNSRIHLWDLWQRITLAAPVANINSNIINVHAMVMYANVFSSSLVHSYLLICQFRFNSILAFTSLIRKKSVHRPLNFSSSEKLFLLDFIIYRQIISIVLNSHCVL